MFGDPVLDDLQARAIQANPELHGAILRFAQARMQRRIVSSAYLPEVTLEGGVSRQKQSLYGMNNRLLEATEPGNREALEKALGDPFHAVPGRLRRFVGAGPLGAGRTFGRGGPGGDRHGRGPRSTTRC
ncbi:hypothetical protein BH79_27510 [Pseudomonas aeruginosa C0324C]|nr:hypothetical protein BH79_27510 [Pseudomonas aeruginosa C0324C]